MRLVSACLNERKLPEAQGKLKCGVSFVGKSLSQWPLLEKNEISVTLLCSLQKEGMGVVLSILPLMRVIWILEGNLL